MRRLLAGEQPIGADLHAELWDLLSAGTANYSPAADGSVPTAYNRETVRGTSVDATPRAGGPSGDATPRDGDAVRRLNHSKIGNLVVKANRSVVATKSA